MKKILSILCLLSINLQIDAQEITKGIDKTVNFGDDKVVGETKLNTNLNLKVSVTTKEIADKPISSLLPGYLFEMGCDMETGMYSEMLFNRHFATFVSYQQNHDLWYDLRDRKSPDKLIEDWSTMHWFHSGYEHNIWYAAPGEVNDYIVNESSTMYKEKSNTSKTTLSRIRVAETQNYFLRIKNNDKIEFGGLAQNGKYLRPGMTYTFKGKIRILKGGNSIKMKFFKKDDWNTPIIEETINELTSEFKNFEIKFKNTNYEGFATFALWIPAGAIVDVSGLSLMPDDNIEGWRKDVIDMVSEQIKPGVLRWPGGIYASFYDWKDGVGEPNLRPVRVNYRWAGFMYNDVGTLEFYRYCKETNAEPLICVNLFSPSKENYNYYGKDGKPSSLHDFYLPQFTKIEEGAKLAADWVAYCNAPVGKHPMADLRAKHGHPEPLNIKYWEMDNESFRFFQSFESYANACVVYSKAMKAIDPTIKIGLCTYGDILSNNVAEMLEIAGKDIDFLADRGTSEKNIATKIGYLKNYNLKHGTKIVYTNTEYIVGSASTKESLKRADKSVRDKVLTRVTWGYTLDWANLLMLWQRYGGDVLFTNYNQFVNNHQSSVFDTPREGSFAKYPVVVGSLFRDSPARWPLQLENYTPDVNNSLQVQVAWNDNKSKLVIYALNYNDSLGNADIDLSKIDKMFHKASYETLAGPSLETMRTVKIPNEMVKKVTNTKEVIDSKKISIQIPPRSFMQIIIE